MSCKLQILKGSIEDCIVKIVEKEQINRAIIGPTVSSMICFTPIYSCLRKNKIPIITPDFPLVYSNSDRLACAAKEGSTLVFGGGTLIDFVKVCAKKNSFSLTVLLASISNDGFASSFSSLRPDEVSYNKSYLSKPPDIVYACLPLLNQHMPHKLLVSGLGELLSKLNVWEDLKLDEKIKTFDATPFYQVEEFMDEYTRQDKNLLAKVIERLYSFSLLMKDDSSWCSRSEHEFEKLYADNAIPHGQLVLMGALVAMKIRDIFRLPHAYERLLCYCNKLEINLELKKAFETIAEPNLCKRMTGLSLVRPERFGLWNLIRSETIDWISIVHKIIKEL